MLQGKSWIHFQGGKWNETPTDQGKSLLLVQRHKKKHLSLSLCVCVFPSPSNILCWDDGQNVGCKQHAGAACDVIWQISFRTNAKSGPKIVSSFSLFFFFSFCLVFVKPGDMGIELEGEKKKISGFLRVGHAGFALQFLTQLLLRLCIHARSRSSIRLECK